MLKNCKFLFMRRRSHFSKWKQGYLIKIRYSTAKENMIQLYCYSRREKEQHKRRMKK